MPHPISVRFRDHRVAEGLKREATAAGQSASALAETLIDEGLRTRRHPLIVFRGGPSGRRAAVAGGPDVCEIVAGVVGGDVPASERLQRATEVFGLPPELVAAAFAYYAEFASEIDTRIEANGRAADEAEALWRRRDDLLRR